MCMDPQADEPLDGKANACVAKADRPLEGPDVGAVGNADEPLYGKMLNRCGKRMGQNQKKGQTNKWKLSYLLDLP